MQQLRTTLLTLLLFIITSPLIAADPAKEVVVYTALDREFSEPILKQFEARTGIVVKPVYDSEAVKTVGLVNRLLAERQRPRADVFWNNELLRSIQLQEEGLSQPYISPSAAGIPAAMKDKEGHWTGFGARVRVFLVNTKLLTEKEKWPTTVKALADPEWKGRCAVARPLFGTTNTHGAAMWATAGPDQTKAFWTDVSRNAILVGGNLDAAKEVSSGRAAFCLTDTDDAFGELQDGASVAIVYPAADLGGKGTLLIPNTVMLMKGAPHEAEGKALIDYLLSEEVERNLAASRSAQIPVRASIPPPKGLPPIPEGGILAADWRRAYETLPAFNNWAVGHFQP